MYEITYRIAQEIIGHEAIVRQTYYDSVKKPTWSVGLTSATGHVVERYWKKPQSLEHCLRVYVWALDNYAEEVREVFKGTHLTEAEFGAALSFHWNTGKIKQASWVKSFKAGNHAQARKQFMMYNRPKEIIERREKEAALLFDGIWSSNGMTTEYTRVKDNGYIDWGSAKRINITDELKQALKGDIPDSDKVIITETVIKEEQVEVPVQVPVPVTPPSSEAPWWRSKEFLAPILSATGLGAISSFFEKFGGIPVWNLTVILGFTTFMLIIVLLYFKRRDVQRVEEKVSRL